MLNLVIENKKVFMIIKSFNILNNLSLKTKTVVIIKIKTKIAKVFNKTKTAKVFRKVNITLSF